MNKHLNLKKTILLSTAIISLFCGTLLSTKVEAGITGALEAIDSGDLPALERELAEEESYEEGDKAQLFHRALCKKRMDLFNALIEKFGVENTKIYDSKRTLLHEVVAGFSSYTNGDITQFLQPLTKRGADITLTDRYGRTPLHDAVARGSVEVVEALLVAGANATINSKTHTGKNTPLHLAVMHGEKSPSLIKTLLDHGADIDSQNSNGETPLHLAVANGNLAAVRTLLEKSADPNLLGQYGTPLAIAESGEIRQLLLMHNAINPMEGTSAYIALQKKSISTLWKKDVQEINQLLEDNFPEIHRLPETLPERTNFRNKLLNPTMASHYGTASGVQEVFDKLSEQLILIIADFFKDRQFLENAQSLKPVFEFMGTTRAIIHRNADGDPTVPMGKFADDDGVITDNIGAPSPVCRRALEEFYARMVTQKGRSCNSIWYIKDSYNRFITIEFASRQHYRPTHASYHYPQTMDFHLRLIKNFLETDERNIPELKRQLLTLLHGLSWSTTYYRGQAAITLWLLRGLAEVRGYTLLLTNRWSTGSSHFPYDVEALITLEKEEFVRNCMGNIILVPNS